MSNFNDVTLKKVLSTPDKLTYKATITNVLRDQIQTLSRDLLEKQCNLSYLEIGFNKGYTLVALKDSFSSLVGIDIEPKYAETAKNLFSSKQDVEKIKLITGTSKDIPADAYDVVLIDAAHDYDNVKLDYQNVLSKNTCKKYVIYFHDYGLCGAGIKRFLHETFSEDSIKLCGMQVNWNPLGSNTEDWEAAYVIIEN